MSVLIVLAEKCHGKRLLQPVLQRHTENYRISCAHVIRFIMTFGGQNLFIVINTWTFYYYWKINHKLINTLNKVYVYIYIYVNFEMVKTNVRFLSKAASFSNTGSCHIAERRRKDQISHAPFRALQFSCVGTNEHTQFY